MARGKQEPTTPDRTHLLVPLEEARARVQVQLDRGANVPNESINENDEARRWYEFTSELLRQICSTDELRDEFTGRSSFSIDPDISTGSYLKKLRSIHERLELLPASKPSLDGVRAAPHRTGDSRKQKTNTRCIFVVHGHDDGVKETVARFLTKLQLEPVVLHEQPNRARTIIEKFEDHSDVAFAVALFTPDDVGFPASKSDDAKPRARQNVVLELGFFMAALGRERVCVLCKSGVEVPSDYAGVLYHQLDDSGAWRFLLAREIKAAGIDVDLNKAIVIVHLGGRVMQQGATAARGPQRLAAGKAQAGCAAPPRTRLAHSQGRSGVAA
jgi:predicted nucleotide-binding protein